MDLYRKGKCQSSGRKVFLLKSVGVSYYVLVADEFGDDIDILSGFPATPVLGISIRFSTRQRRDLSLISIVV